ncbi:MAG: hypothetical protein COU10_02775 [Candidatus Harrisonbacteria bacterium CG10_big_fil_rev_8_21_14_0_10_45_28]|uniref:Uncharacterized protein n=1 Tax=Candidatus Harrisonbacteria bacterium CG10_big_fil_rev_8_21_14_0_10_45_28 TaxID=1974586 RepID=A0A2H0UN08_9BACT|nr:MAG: hypothetical protein COU10_02775 [Candidatus Harrisonbacteria bacterium CG10_big_fil_rev_8_21_14_0_10_45_28]
MRKAKNFLVNFGARITRPPSGSLYPAIIKATIFGLAVLIVELYNFPWPMSLGFIVLALILYFNPLANARRLFFTFLFLLIFTFLITTKFAIDIPKTSAVYPSVAFAVFFAALFYLLIGIKQLLFIRRAQAYYLLYLSVLYQGFLLYFASEKTDALPAIFKFLLLVLFLFHIIREFFRINNQSKTRFLTATVFSLTLVNLEIIWAISLLPIEFTSAASLATLFAFLSTETIRRYFQEELTAKFLRYSLLVSVSLFAVILAFSRWTP